MAKDKVKKAKAAPAASSEKVAKKKAAFISLEDKDAVATKKAKTPYSERRAIVYVSHLPHGFYEKQLRDYLGQFGAITNLRLGRSTKTGGSKGYAFVEFKYPEVAKIVADTMNNYLMFDKLVKCEVIPADRMSKACFRGKVNPDNPPAKQARYEAKKQINALRTEEQNNARLKKQLKKLEKVKAKLEAAGMTVDMQFEKKMKASSGKKIRQGHTPHGDRHGRERGQDEDPCQRPQGEEQGQQRRRHATLFQERDPQGHHAQDEEGGSGAGASRSSDAASGREAQVCQQEGVNAQEAPARHAQE